MDSQWGDAIAAVRAKRSRWSKLVMFLGLVAAGNAAFWLPCWRGRMATCDFWCAAGAAAACNVLGRNHDDGDGTAIRDDLAVASYRQACDGGHVTACVNLGIMYENAEGVAPDPFAAAALYRTACPTKASACRRFAALVVEEGVPPDAVVAQALERACDGHDEDAMKSCNGLARLYDAGRGVPLDDKHAAKLYGRACEGHLGIACHNLAIMYRKGEGVARDRERARELEARSCENSRASRCRKPHSM